MSDRDENAGMVAARLGLRRNTGGSCLLSWEGLLNLAVDAYWARRNYVQPAASRTEGEARKGRRRLGGVA